MADFLDFSGGMNFDDLPEMMQSNQLVEGKNLDLKGKGIVRGRFSDLLVETYADPIDDWFYQTLFGGGGHVVRCGSNLFDGTTLIKADCPDQRHRFCEYQGWLCWTDGNKNWKYRRQGFEGGFLIGMTNSFEYSFASSFDYSIGLALLISEAGYTCMFPWEKQMVDGETVEDGDRNCPLTEVDSALSGEPLWCSSPVEIGLDPFAGISYEATYCYPWEEDYFSPQGELIQKAELLDDECGSLTGWEQISSPAGSVTCDETSFRLAVSGVGSMAIVRHLELIEGSTYTLTVDYETLVSFKNIAAYGQISIASSDFGYAYIQLMSEGFNVNGLSYISHGSLPSPGRNVLTFIINTDKNLISVYRDGEEIAKDHPINFTGTSSNYVGVSLISLSDAAQIKVHSIQAGIYIDDVGGLENLTYAKATTTVSVPQLFQFPQMETCFAWEEDLLRSFLGGAIGYCYPWELNLAKDLLFPGNYLGKDYLAQCLLEYKVGRTTQRMYMYNWELQFLQKKKITAQSGQMIDLCSAGKGKPYMSPKKGTVVQMGGSFWFEDDTHNLDTLFRYRVSFGNAFSRYGNAGFLCVNGGPGSYIRDLPISNDPQVTSRWIWRTEMGGFVYKLCDIVENNSDTEWLDTVGVGLTTEELAIDHVKPSGCLDLCEHQSLLYMLQSPNLLYWPLSYGDWESYPESNYEPIGSSARVGVRILPLGQELICYNDLEVWRYLGAVEDDYAKKLSLANHRPLGADCLCSDGQVHFFYDRAGVFVFDSVRDVTLPVPVEQVFKRNSQSDWTADQDLLSTSIMCFLDGSIYIAYALNGSTVRDSLLIIEPGQKRATVLSLDQIDNFGVDPLGQRLFYTVGDELHELVNSPQAGSTSLGWSFVTKNFDSELGAKFQRKGFRWIKLFADPNSGSITVEFSVDGTSIKTWTLTGDRQIQRFRVDPDPSGYNCSLSVTGTEDSEFYGFSLEDTVLNN